MHSPSAPVPASVRVSKVEKMLIDFYRLYKPERETRVPTIVAEFVRRGGGDSELAALNEELRQVSLWHSTSAIFYDLRPAH